MCTLHGLIEANEEERRMYRYVLKRDTLLCIEEGCFKGCGCECFSPGSLTIEQQYRFRPTLRLQHVSHPQHHTHLGTTLVASLIGTRPTKIPRRHTPLYLTIPSRFLLT